MNWLNGLTEQDRQQVFFLMRSIRSDSDRFLAKAISLQPRSGEVPVGGTHIDEFARGESLAVFLRGLNKGESPEKALEMAKEEAALIFRNWNKRRKDHQVHRWEGNLNSYLEGVCGRFRMFEINETSRHTK